MNPRLLSFLVLSATMMIPASAAHASVRAASKYLHSRILAPGALSAGTEGQRIQHVGNPMNSRGTVGTTGDFGGPCGDSPVGVERAFVYFPKRSRYVVLGDPPGMGSTSTEAVGIADDNSVGVWAYSCSRKETFIYRVTSVATTPEWSQPCACQGYSSAPSYLLHDSPVGYNSDGVALNNRKRGPSVLSFPHGVPKVSPLVTSVGVRAKARITAVGTPRGFVGTQYKRKNHYVATVWLEGKGYLLPVAGPSTDRPIPLGMVERNTAHGLRIDVVGSLRHRPTGGNGPYWDGTDYWIGRPTAKGFVFVEKRRFIRDRDIGAAFGISTDGSMIFGINGYLEGLEVYFTASHKTLHGGPGCGIGPAWGDSKGNILVAPDSHDWMCLAQTRH